jgi:hypothetical protein
MSSSEGTGAAGKAVAAKPRILSTSDAADADRAEETAADPWFTPGPKSAAVSSSAGEDAAAAGDDAAAAGWFLPAGRAGLLPDSMTVSWEDGAAAPPDLAAPQEAGGTPPWGAESDDSAAGAPPPWENGPWPGPGESAVAAEAGPSPSRPQVLPTEGTAAWLRRGRVRVALAAATGAVGIIVIIAVILIVTSGGSGCGTYPLTVRQAYASAMSDLRSQAPAPVQATAFGLAASRANAAAAATGQLAMRSALFSMATDLDQAHADVIAHRALPPALLQNLTADRTELSGSCPG